MYFTATHHSQEETCLHVKDCWFEMCWFFQPPGVSAPTDRKVAGLLEWDSVSNTMDALAMMNHYQMKNESEWSTDSLYFMHINH